MRYMWVLIVSTLILQSCFEFGEEVDYEMDSDEAKNGIELLLHIKPDSNISHIHYYQNSIGIDPYGFLKFHADSNTVDRIVEHNGLILDSSKYISEDGEPSWFTPNSSIKYLHYSKTVTGVKSEHLIFDNSQNLVYYASFTM